MGKITIKHFLNTNLKPYVINKLNYYSIYLLITANRKTTKLKSLVFNEYYTEKDFEEIFYSENIEDKNLIKNEISAINIISEISIEVLNEFNTAFVTAFINFSNTISVWKSNTELYDYNSGNNLFSEGNFLGVKLDEIYLLLTKDTMQDELTIFEFYSYEKQNIILNFLKNRKLRNPKELLQDINKILFYTSLEFFKWYIEGNKKNADLKNRFTVLFDCHKELIKEHLEKKYKIK